jgi:hypothetical protein
MTNKALAIFGIVTYILTVLSSAENLEGDSVYPNNFNCDIGDSNCSVLCYGRNTAMDNTQNCSNITYYFCCCPRYIFDNIRHYFFLWQLNYYSIEYNQSN